MPSRKASRSSLPPRGDSNFPSRPELVCLVQPQAGMHARAGAMEAPRAADAGEINKLIKAAGAAMVPVFGSEGRVAASRAAQAAADASELPALNSYYTVDVAEDKMDKLARDLAGAAGVVCAYIKPPASPAVYLAPDTTAAPAVEDALATASFVGRQTYLDVAPGGIDARHAWTRGGGKGQGVRVIDIEGAWRFSHEDLLENQGGVISGTATTDLAWRNHGTAVVGVFGGDENAFGVTGIAPQANTRAISIFGAGSGSAIAIRRAADALAAGDIILIELHRPGPGASGAGQDGFIAIEWWPDDFAAIVYARSRGVIVVEAAGNGARNLDLPIYNTPAAGFPASWRNPFNLANPQSGAIVVGAGAPPPGTHGRNHGPDRSRLDFSNHGARVDAQGWGREVTTTGYGDLQGGTNEDLWYTDTFSGTSSASPVVVGALACIQGALRVAGRPLLTPATARDILRTTGSAQTDAPGRPASQRIGNRPNLRQALERLLPVVKAKEFKEVKIEKVEKLEKLERKETKEFKESKEKVEILEKLPREKSPFEKNPKEKSEKEVFEGGGGKLRDGPLLGGGGPDLETRLTQLEQGLAALSHFIGPELRPALEASALNHEPDLQAMADELQARADEARAAKNLRDTAG